MAFDKSHQMDWAGLQIIASEFKTVGGVVLSDSDISLEAGVAINDLGAAVNFRVESDGDANMLFVDGTNNRVGVGTATPAVPLDVVGAIAGSTSITGDTLVGTTSVSSASVALTGTLKLDTVSQALTATIALAAGATNSIDATITMKDMAGATVTGVQQVEVFITESATGALGLTADAASGALTASTGVVLTALTAKKHIRAVTDTNGVLVLNLVDSAKPADQYFAVVRPFGSLAVSAASGTSWGA